MHGQMSHQTGARFATVSFQTTEFIKRIKQASPDQTIYTQVPTFRAGIKAREKRQAQAQSIYGKLREVARVTFQVPIQRNDAE